MEKLEKERSTVSTRTVLNLIIVVGIASVGVYILIMMLTNLDFSVGNWESSAFHVESRINRDYNEIFAYFFLNLYRSGVQEIKYFRNEITNVMLKKIAVRAASGVSNSQHLERVVDSLLNTERNFILRAGETTVGIATNLTERTADNEMLETIKSSFAAGVNAFKDSTPKASTDR